MHQFSNQSQPPVNPRIDMVAHQFFIAESAHVPLQNQGVFDANALRFPTQGSSDEIYIPTAGDLGAMEGLATDENLLNGSSLSGLHDPLEGEERAQGMDQRGFVHIQDEDDNDFKFIQQIEDQKRRSRLPGASLE
jgi:hypothetical protein